MKLFVAPLQGHTDAVFRHYHAETYGDGADAYYSPFMRVENGQVRNRDLVDVTSDLNANHNVVPQIIFRDVKECDLLFSVIADKGLPCVDLNLGCPFPPQVKHGRGSAVLKKPELLNEIRSLMLGYPMISFSVKMRLGVESPAEWGGVIDILNDMPLTHVTVHPRVAVQQYGGSLHLDEFEKLLRTSAHPVVFNGEMRAPEDLDIMQDRFPGVAGIMVGRGLLGRPSLINEFLGGCAWGRERRVESILNLHRKMFLHYRQTLCGDTQILMKIKSFWDYLEPEIGHKAAKAIRKATSVMKYEAAISGIEMNFVKINH